MKRTYVITGGCGFIGSNVAEYYLTHANRVILFDNFSRHGASHNATWLKNTFGDLVTTIRGDVRNPGPEFFEAVQQADVVIHLAAQVAVTTSVTDPRTDFEINALGTFNVLEAVRKSRSRPIVLYSSTNKVYGKMLDLMTIEHNGRYAYKDLPNGIDEARALDFYSPYGCSKGTGDQYVIDYARMYGLRTTVLRQSCIYGPRQFGIEDQGWVAWFAIRALQRRPVTIFGDGKQVRDVLYVGDLVAAYDQAIANIDRTTGQAYNIGGGRANTLSLLELVKFLESRLGTHVEYTVDNWRPGDQLVFVSDVRKARADFGWEPRTDVETGIGRMLEWLEQDDRLFATAMVAGV